MLASNTQSIVYWRFVFLYPSGMLGHLCLWNLKSANGMQASNKRSFDRWWLAVAAVWPDLAKFPHFGKIIKVFGNF